MRMRSTFSCTILIATALALSGCDTEARSTIATAEAAPAGVVVDSVLPIEEALRRFRAGLPDPVSLGGRFAERDSLVAAFGNALFRADTAALAGLLVDRAEFAYLYYPDSHFAREPYELDPAILWFQLQNGTSKGITRALRRFGDRGYVYVGYECEAQPTLQGESRLWESCVVSYEDPSGQRLAGRFFGSILEHGGRFKILSYANPL
jgi:hypothetical protein